MDFIFIKLVNWAEVSAECENIALILVYAVFSIFPRGESNANIFPPFVWNLLLPYLIFR